jgi:hypothetical protein
MNPYNYIIDNFYPNSNFALEAAAVLLLSVLADGYTGTMPAGSNPYRWVLEQLSVVAPDNDFRKSLATQWNTRATS